MTEQKPGLYGVTHSNRDFAQADTWGKNQFNSSFPAGLTNYLSSKELENVYLFLDKELKVQHGKISTTELFLVLHLHQTTFSLLLKAHTHPTSN